MQDTRRTPHPSVRWTRRRAAALLGGLSGSALLAACGGQATGGQTDVKTRAPVTLRSWIFQPGNPEPN